ncbi:hypothetical protein PRZ48_011108 [Zasmidium cellare]|uniref:Uncharacterized protein n=1 Tax=Zasmidium cellare TaxID=395010 RepID=A0ABR0EBC7_ZASCE|nr:hypothetical protein PRZ48_011108 [Zasmidium cellare]
MAAFAAPNLEELFLCRELTLITPALLAASKDARQKWHGDELREGKLREGKKNKQGSLTTLVLAGQRYYDDIRVWTEKTDFAKLRTFKLYRDVPVEILRWFSEVRPFSEALEEVGIDFSYRCGIEASDAIQSFLDSLLALRRLRLLWIHKQSLQEAALRRHGDRLHTLLLDKTIQDITTLSNIRESCPNLS